MTPHNVKPFPPRAAAPPHGGAAAVDGDVPPGSLREVITWLEMSAPPPRRRTPGRLGSIALMQARRPAVSFYRYLYNQVGEPWLWHERRRLDDAALSAIIHDSKVRINVVYCSGAPAGFAELDLRAPGEIEIAYFGLLPEYTGRGLGGFLLERTIEQAWRSHPRRVWVHTCNLDAPGALALYQKNGFAVYKQEARLIRDPRTEGILPATAAPHIPLRQPAD